MSVGRFYDDIEIEYGKVFNSFALMFGKTRGTNEKKYIKLLQKAIKRGSEVSKEELVTLYGQRRYKLTREMYDNPEDYL